MVELPQYTLKPHINSMLAPWILKLLGLSIVLYAGVFLNIRLGMISGVDRIPPAINLFIFALLIVLVVSQVVIYHVKFANYKYLFFTDRIEFKGKKSVTFRLFDFTEAQLKQGVFDKMFNTGTLIISKDFRIGPIPNASQVKGYLEQLVKYYRYSQSKSQAMAASQSAQPSPARKGV